MISNQIQKSEGSLVFNALSALAYEMERLYIQADFIMDQTFAKTADYEHLRLRALERGLEPYEATHAYVRAEFDAAVPIGARFNLKAYNYVTIENINGHEYRLKCEEAGTGPNELLGKMTALTFVPDLSHAEIKELLVPGKDGESRDAFYERYLESFQTRAYGGNVSAYRQHVEAMEGIGRVKVFPVWNGGGTVKLVLLDSSYRAASDYLVGLVKADVCPEPYKGYGWAPIGHDVTVTAAEEAAVTVTTKIIFADGSTWNTCQEDVKAAIDSYIQELRRDWASEKAGLSLTIYISRLESRVLEHVKTIVDIQDTAINGIRANLTLTPEQIPVLGEVTMA